jgi:hypothetical protein
MYGRPNARQKSDDKGLFPLKGGVIGLAGYGFPVGNRYL